MQDSGPITTETSASEGRLKVSVGGKSAKKKKLKSIIKKYKDGKGGPGNMLPTGATSITDIIPSAAQPNPSLAAMTPGIGVPVTPNTYSPQQKMQMAMSGMQPIGSGASPVSKTSSFGNTPPPPFNRLSNKPHRSMVNIKAPKLKKLKMVKMKSLKSMVKASSKRGKALSF